MAKGAVGYMQDAMDKMRHHMTNSAKAAGDMVNCPMADMQNMHDWLQEAHSAMTGEAYAVPPVKEVDTERRKDVVYFSKK